VARFFASVRPRRVSPAGHAWVAATLSAAELELFDRMSGPDQHHSLEVARRVEATMGELEPSLHPTVLCAALLHDVGKSAAGLGTYGRVVATLSGMVGGRGFAEAWQSRRGFTRKVGLYLRYGEIGADMLRLAGSDPLVVAWSTEHHLAPERWTMPRSAGEVLVAADG
jgi:hypothetical protein